MPGYTELVDLARLCAQQAHLTSSKEVARELWRIAQEYQRRAAKLHAGPLPDIGSPPVGVED